MTKNKDKDENGLIIIDAEYDTTLSNSEIAMVSNLKKGDILKDEHLIAIANLINLYQILNSDINRQMILNTRKEIKRLMGTVHVNVNKDFVKARTIGLLLKNLNELEKKQKKNKAEEKPQKSLYDLQKGLK